MTTPSAHRVLAAVDAASAEIVDFAAELVRIPTVNPPGDHYKDAAEAVGRHLAACGFEVEYHGAEGRPEHTAAHPRINVVGTRRGRAQRPLVHLNGHYDVVPAGEGWSVDPFAGVVRDGRLYGRGASDMKAGIAAAVFAAEAIRRAGIELEGTIEVSATPDEESGGFSGVAWLCERGRIAKGRTDFAIIPEPFGPERICIGHRGVYWFEVTTRGVTAHGSMPFLGQSAIDSMGALLEAVRTHLKPALAKRRTAMPVVPEGARHATINVNAIGAGQIEGLVQTPCVPDRARAVFDRRFLAEEGFESARAEIVALLQALTASAPSFEYELRDLMVVHPSAAPETSPLVASLRRGVADVTGRSAQIVASPGTYDQKHMTGIAGIANCVAYGPGVLEMAHRPNEWCGVGDLLNATKVLALTLLDLCGVA